MSWQPGGLLELRTDRFLVRSMAREDVTDDLISWLADPDVMLGLNMPRCRLSRPQAVRFVLDVDHRSRFVLGIWPHQQAQLIGMFTLECDLQHGCAETAVVVGDRAWWGKDVVREARSALLDFLFGTMNLYKVIGRPHGRNFASIYNYKTLGFRCEAVLREQMQAAQGTARLDQLIFGMLRSEWRARKASTLTIEGGM